MHTSRDELPIGESSDGYEGRFAKWGGLTVCFETYAAGLDAAPLLVGLPDDACACPHWGFVFKGEIVVRYPDREETITAGQAYYMEPGHVPVFAAGTEVLELSRSTDLEAHSSALSQIRARR